MSQVMPLTATHLGILLVSVAGFFVLALATERHAEHLLGRMPAPRWRLLARIIGWTLLAVSLAWGIAALGSGVGTTLWLGWLCVAALILVFGFPKWPWRPPARERPARPPGRGAGQSMAPPVQPRVRRRIAIALSGLTVAVFAIGLARVEEPALVGDEAIHGQIGPWTFTFAEADREPPEVMAMDTPMKTYHMRFCEACDLEIGQAYLKVNRPRSARATGMAFMGQRWERRAEIPLPSTVTADSELWLTVVGKDGSVHQAAWPMSRLSPATVTWFEEERKRHAAR